MNRQSRQRFSPRLETLEDRCTPSVAHAPLGDGLAHGAHAVVLHVHHDHHEKIVPFKIDGGGPAPDGLPLVPGMTAAHSATGHATGLGTYHGQGTFVLGSLNISATGAVTGTFQGTFVFAGAHAKLAVNYGSGFSGNFTGQVSADGASVMNVTFDAMFTPDAAHSTGRFAHATGGGWRMIAKAEPIALVPASAFTAPFNYTWSGKGFLEFSKGHD